MGVSQIKPFEAVILDTDLLDQMCVRMGYTQAESAITSAMEDLAVLLQYCGTLYRAEEYDTLRVTCQQIEGVAKRVGMSSLARVAKDVASLSQSGDSAALAATVGRLRRLGEQSLIAIWDREDLSI
jgi:hypothetical protein